MFAYTHTQGSPKSKYALPSARARRGSFSALPLGARSSVWWKPTAAFGARALQAAGEASGCGTGTRALAPPQRWLGAAPGLLWWREGPGAGCPGGSWIPRRGRGRIQSPSQAPHPSGVGEPRVLGHPCWLCGVPREGVEPPSSTRRTGETGISFLKEVFFFSFFFFSHPYSLFINLTQFHNSQTCKAAGLFLFCLNLSEPAKFLGLARGAASTHGLPGLAWSRSLQMFSAGSGS